MPTQAKKDSNARHIAKLDIIKIQPYKEEGAAIRAAAAAAGRSVQRYILEAVREKMRREGSGAVHDGPATDAAGTEDIRRMAKSPKEGSWGSDDGQRDGSICSDGVDAPGGAAGVSPAQDEELSPSKLSPDDWAEWARRQDEESLEDWKARLKKSNIGTSPADIMKRIGKLPKDDRNLILGD